MIFSFFYDFHPTLMTQFPSREQLERLIYDIYYSIDANEALVLLETTTSAAPVLIEMLEDWENISYKKHANVVWVLGKLQVSEAVPILIEYANRNTGDNRAAAIEALGNIGNASAIPALENFLRDQTFLSYEEDYGAYWLFRSYCGKRISDIAAKAIERIRTLAPYEGEDACTQCLGWKRVDEEEQLSWKYWEEHLERSQAAIRMDLVKPVACPHCNGTGVEPEVG